MSGVVDRHLSRHPSRWEEQRSARASASEFVENLWIDPGPETRFFSREDFERKARFGPPRAFPGLPMEGSHIFLAPREMQGLSDTQRALVSRVRRAHRRYSFSSRDRRTYYLLNEVERLASLFELGEEAINRCKYLLTRVMREIRTFRGLGIGAVAAAVVLFEMRSRGFAVSFREVEKKTGVDRNLLWKAWKKILKIVGGSWSKRLRVLPPERHAGRLINDLQLPSTLNRDCYKLIKILRKIGACGGKNPASIAAAVLYIVCRAKGLKVTQREIARVAGVSEVTLRNRYKDILKILKKKNVDVRRLLGIH